jgi:hypothetical protein
MGRTEPLDIPPELVHLIDQHTERMEREDWERRRLAREERERRRLIFEQRFPRIYFLLSSEGEYFWGLEYQEELEEPEAGAPEDEEPQKLVIIDDMEFYPYEIVGDVQTARISAANLCRLQSAEKLFEDLLDDNLLLPA